MKQINTYISPCPAHISEMQSNPQMNLFSNLFQNWSGEVFGGAGSKRDKYCIAF